MVVLSSLRSRAVLSVEGGGSSDISETQRYDFTPVRDCVPTSIGRHMFTFSNIRSRQRVMPTSLLKLSHWNCFVRFAGLLDPRGEES